LVVTARNERGIGVARVWDLRLIRSQLREIGLDWAFSPCAPLRDAEPVKPIQVEVDLGEFGEAVK
jgi:hypothetical protein